MYNMVGEMDAARVASHSTNSTPACEVSSENSSWWWVLQRAVRQVRIEVVIKWVEMQVLAPSIRICHDTSVLVLVVNKESKLEGVTPMYECLAVYEQLVSLKLQGTFWLYRIYTSVES
jgi:hypothetical protein